MQCYFDPRQLHHAPPREWLNGAYVAHAETPARAEGIRDRLGDRLAVPTDHGLWPILAIHDAAYVAFLQRAHTDWVAAGRDGDAQGYAWPITRRRPLTFNRIDADLGRYSFDAVTPIAAGTWDAAYWSAQAALSAVDAVLAGDPAAFALSRPPGHHCGADYLGGYCYLNNAAIAAEAAAATGRRVAILDIDYHHGNGTQDIFYERGDILFASLHADPVVDFPFYWGHADERGAGAGEGATLNLPMRRGTAMAAYLPKLETALDAVRAHGTDLLIISYGADTFVDDPISQFRLTTADYAVLGQRLAATGLPAVIVMEGGYAVDALGANVASFLSGWP
jgi:acetoin utilization deacetylase AcuC-like enzyme